MAKAKKTTIKVTGGRKKNTSARRSSSRKQVKEMPHWQYILIATLVSSFIMFIAYHLMFKQILFRFTTCEGVKIYETCIPKGYNVYGLDISHHQGKINWAEVKKSGIEFAMIRVGFRGNSKSGGGIYEDTYFKLSNDILINKVII